MSAFDNLYKTLGNNYQRAERNYKETAEASEGQGMDGMQEMFEGQIEMAQANFALTEGFKAKHNMTKTVLDGFQ